MKTFNKLIKTRILQYTLNLKKKITNNNIFPHFINISFSKISKCTLNYRYYTKQSISEVPVMLELWGMQRTPSLASLSCLL